MAVTVLVRSTEPHLVERLAAKLDAREYRLEACDVSCSLMDCVTDHRPDVLLLEEPPSGSSLKAALQTISAVRPGVKVIYMSRRSCRDDAKLVEQGLFYYTVRPALEEILQVVEAAGEAVRRDREEELHWALSSESKAERRRKR